MTETPFDRVLEELRSLDFERYLSLLVIAEEPRRALTALYGLNAEIAKVRELVSEPMLGEIRLQWWRETAEHLFEGETRGHDVAACLAELLPGSLLGAEDLIDLIDGRSRDLEAGLFQDFGDLDAYVEATQGQLMRLGAKLLAGKEIAPGLDTAITAGARAYAYMGFLRALPYHASQGYMMLPQSLLAKHEVELEDLFNGVARPGLYEAMREMAQLSQEALNEMRRHMGDVPKSCLPVFLPLAVLPLYQKRYLARKDHPFRERVEVPAFRLQWRFLTAQWRGRI